MSLVKDINSGFGSSPTARRSFTLGNAIYFPANDGINGDELWKSDGTSGGTTLLKNINATAGSSAKCFHSVGNSLFFIANDGVNGEELWKTDGTSAGTKLVKDITPGSTKTEFKIPFLEENTFVDLNGKLYFIVANVGLYVSDGTDIGTKLVSSFSGAYGLTVHNGKLYFINSNTIYQSDGTSAGTNTFGAGGTTPRDLYSTPIGLFYNSNSELWMSNGTASGTNLVTKFGFFASFDLTKSAIFYKNKFYFVLNDDTGIGKQVWSSDGTASGTQLLKKIATNKNSAGFRYFCIANNYLFFLFNNMSSEPRQLWRTDGTETGTIQLTDVDGGPLNFISNENEPKELNGKLYFFAEKNSKRYLYTSAGNVADTKQETLIYSYFTPFSLGLLPLSGKILFSGQTDVDSSIGEELWSYALPFSADISSTGTIKCNGDKTASLEVKSTGGVAPFSYQWSPSPSSTSTLKNVSGGNYSVTVTDATGKQVKSSLVIGQPTAITVVTTVTATASNQNTGTITAFAQGGTAPFSYSWNTVPVQNTAKAINLAKGNYTVTVTDKNGCTAIQNASINVSNTNEVAEQLGLTIFPNPASNELSLKFNEYQVNKVISYNIINTLGQITMSNTIQSDKLNIDISSLSNGIYVLKLNIDNKVATSSFVVSK